MSIRWATGVTTVPSRLNDLLPRTLASLSDGGFDRPRLFIDGAERKDNRWDKFGLEVTMRCPAVRTYGNWMLSAAELYIREPTADRFAIFQDDMVTYRNLRQYLEAVPYPDDGYLNLYTFPSNQDIAPLADGTCSFYQSRELQSGPMYQNGKAQTGRGAVALVFDRDALITLLSSRHTVERPLSVTDGWKKVDGGIVTAMNKAGYREYVHNPSLVQHIGAISSMGNRPHKQATSFRGEEFDAMELIKG